MNSALPQAFKPCCRLEHPGGGRTRFSIELSGEFGALPPDFAASLYRVAQEAITNAAKHAQASRVTLRLACRRPPVRISARTSRSTSMTTAWPRPTPP